MFLNEDGKLGRQFGEVYVKKIYIIGIADIGITEVRWGCDKGSVDLHNFGRW